MSKVQLNQLESYILNRFVEVDYQWLSLTDEIHFLEIEPISSSGKTEVLHGLERALATLIKLGVVRLYETTIVKNKTLQRDERLDTPLDLELRYDEYGRVRLCLEDLVIWDHETQRWRANRKNSNLSIVLTDFGQTFVYT
jgi:hypothetical protein